MISWRCTASMLATTSGGRHRSPSSGPLGWSPAAAADPAAPGGLHGDQDAHRDGARRAVGGRRSSPSALSAARPSMPAYRVGRQRRWSPGSASLRLRRVRPVHGLPAADGERHADPRPGAGAAGRSAAACSSRSTQFAPVLQTSPRSPRCTALDALVHAPLTGEAVDGRPGRQRGRLAGRVRRRRGVAVPPGHRPRLSGVTRLP